MLKTFLLIQYMILKECLDTTDTNWSCILEELLNFFEFLTVK